MTAAYALAFLGVLGLVGIDAWLRWGDRRAAAWAEVTDDEVVVL